MTWLGANFSLSQGLEHDEHAPGIGSASAAYKGCNCRYRRVLHDDRDVVVHLLADRLEGNVLLRLNRTAKTTGILLGEESLRDNDVKVDTQASRSDGNQQHQELITQNPAEAMAVEVAQPVERLLTCPIQTAVPFRYSGGAAVWRTSLESS